MVIVATVVHVLLCFAVIGIVLLQSGKGADIGSAFGGAGSQAVFGSMGTPTILGKATTVIAILFTLTSFYLALQGGERVGDPRPPGIVEVHAVTEAREPLPARQEELRAKADRLDPDAWVTAEEVREGLEHYEQVYSELRRALGRRRRRRRGRRRAKPPNSAPPAAG